MPICDDEARKLDYLAGDLDAAEREAFEEHLAACPACREEMAALRALLAGLRSLPRSAPPASLVAATKARLRRRAASAPRAAWLWPVAAAAVMLALALAMLGSRADADLTPLAEGLAAALTPPDAPGADAAAAALSTKALLAGSVMVLAYFFLLRLVDDLGFLALRRRLSR
ncbi:MAG: zf-HC2 domain-containing protein [Candidatus Krumholzibacteriota bacterium]|nr:zf-HC2 domain-containing protein [Candidatus Krumholzibacteriota bacterium]